MFLKRLRTSLLFWQQWAIGSSQFFILKKKQTKKNLNYVKKEMNLYFFNNLFVK